MKRERVLAAMEVDIARAIEYGESPRQIAERLLLIPELGKAVDERPKPAKLLSAAADYLDDGFHEHLVDELRSIASDLSTLDQPVR